MTLVAPPTSDSTLVDHEKQARRLVLRESWLGPLSAIGLILLPALLSFAYITSYGVNLPYADEFFLIPHFRGAHFGTLTAQTLLAQHNEHRILFPRLVMLATAHVTHFNTKAETYVYWLCLCGICAVLFLAFASARGIGQRSLLVFAPASWLVFSLRQWWNLLWGWQVCWALLILLSILAIYLLRAQRRYALCFPLALLCTVAASFTLAAGLVIWPVGLLEIFWLRPRQTNLQLWWLRLAVWVVGALAVFAIYFHFLTYVSPPNWRSPLASLRHPIDLIGFFLALLGEPMSQDPRDAAATGLLLMCLLGYVAFRQRNVRKPHGSAMWLSMMLFGVASAGAVAIGRSALPVEATAPQYSLFGIVGIAGLYLWMADNFRWENRLGTLAFGVMSGLLVVGTASAYTGGLALGPLAMHQRQMLAGYARNFQTETDAHLALLSPAPPAYTRYQLAYLNSEQLSVFYGSPVAPIGLARPLKSALVNVGGDTQFSVDTAEVGAASTGPPLDGSELSANSSPDGSLGTKDDVVTITGWAVDSAAQRAAAGVFIDIDGHTDIPAAYGLARADVGEFFKNSEYNDSGFEAGFSARAFGKGRHAVSIKILSADQSSYYWPSYTLILDVH